MERETTGLRLVDGTPFTFAPPGPARHNSLLVDTIELFGPRYAHHACILYLYDPANNVDIFEQDYMQHLGMPIQTGAHLPDIVLYQERSKLLFLIDMLPSHEGVSQTHRDEMVRRFAGHRTIYTAALSDYDDYERCALTIPWGTLVWIAQIPDHTIYYQ